MSKEAYVFEVSSESFDQYALLNSHKIPVLVEFMGVWSGPAVVMSDLFAGLAKEFAEQFIFAKVDIDEQPALRERYKIENIPTLIVFKDGKAVRTEVGQLQEAEARALLRDFGVYRESDVIREEARAKHLAGDTSAAILMLTEAVKKDPGNVRIALDMVQIFLDVGEIEQAQGLFARIPEQAKQTEMGKALSGQLTFANLAKDLDDITTLEQRVAEQAGDMQARFDLAIRLVSQYEIEGAMDKLFSILETESEFKEGAARELVITLTNMVAPVNADMAQAFRRRLSNLSN